MANNHYDLSSIYTAADKYTVLQLLNALLDKVKDLEIIDLSVSKISPNEIKLVFTFADNTTMETPVITLPYEIQDVNIVNGHLIFTLESGDTYDAGNLGAVSSFSINNAQHLIVTYQDGTIQDLGSVVASLVNIEDTNGNKRFIEGDITVETIEGVTQSYGKWSLSGTHLMIVVAGSTAANTTIGDNTTIADISLPRWVMDKIIPGSFAGGQFVAANNQKFYTSSYTFTEKVLPLLKISNNRLRILNNAGSFTLTNPTEFRIEYDLVIDTD